MYFHKKQTVEFDCLHSLGETSSSLMQSICCLILRCVYFTTVFVAYRMKRPSNKNSCIEQISPVTRRFKLNLNETTVVVMFEVFHNEMISALVLYVGGMI